VKFFLYSFDGNYSHIVFLSFSYAQKSGTILESAFQITFSSAIVSVMILRYFFSLAMILSVELFR